MLAKHCEADSGAGNTEGSRRRTGRSGVLEAGGRAAGFVYFEALHKDARSLTLSVDIVDAGSKASVGTANIPFVVK
jgi:hypothetical protein